MTQRLCRKCGVVDLAPYPRRRLCDDCKLVRKQEIAVRYRQWYEKPENKQRAIQRASAHSRTLRAKAARRVWYEKSENRQRSIERAVAHQRTPHAKVVKRAWYDKNRDAIIARTKAWYKEKHNLERASCLNHYGNACVLCGEFDVSMLTIDHIDNSGREHRKEYGKAMNLAGWLVANGLPGGYQTLCWNCNWEKHIASMTLSNKRGAIYRRNVRKKMLLEMGGMCVCCQNRNPIVLSFDHINGGGNQHKRDLGISNISLWIAKHGTDGFQILCRNCNASKYFLGTCVHKRIMAR